MWLPPRTTHHVAWCYAQHPPQDSTADSFVTFCNSGSLVVFTQSPYECRIFNRELDTCAYPASSLPVLPFSNRLQPITPPRLKSRLTTWNLTSWTPHHTSNISQTYLGCLPLPLRCSKGHLSAVPQAATLNGSSNKLDRKQRAERANANANSWTTDSRTVTLLLNTKGNFCSQSPTQRDHLLLWSLQETSSDRWWVRPVHVEQKAL